MKKQLPKTDETAIAGSLLLLGVLNSSIDYKKLCPKYENKKLVYDTDKVWKPEDLNKNGFSIGEVVWHVNKAKQILTEFKIVVEPRFTEYQLSEDCPLFGRFREYFNSVERVTLKPLNGTWTSGDEYAAVWFNSVMEFSFDLITKDSKVIRSLREKIYRCTFKKADALWAQLNTQ